MKETSKKEGDTTEVTFYAKPVKSCGQFGQAKSLFERYIS